MATAITEPIILLGTTAREVRRLMAPMEHILMPIPVAQLLIMLPTRAQRYSLKPPGDLPSFVDNNASLGFPDFFPQLSRQPEDQLTERNVRHGYAGHAVIDADASSIHDLMFDRLQDGDFVRKLGAYALDILKQQSSALATNSPETSRTSPATLERTLSMDSSRLSNEAQTNFTGPRWHLAARVGARSYFQPPVTKYIADTTERDKWWQQLADPTVPLVTLAKSIPRGQRMDRLLETLVQHLVPLTRAVWVIQVIGCDEIQAAMQTKGGQPLVQAVESYTRTWSLCWLDYIKKLLQEVALAGPSTSAASEPTGPQPQAPPPGQPAPTEATAPCIQPFANAEAQRHWIDRWSYVWRLARYQCDQELLDIRRLLRWIIDEVSSTEKLEHFVLLLPCLIEYIPDIKRARFLLRRLINSLGDRFVFFTHQYHLPGRLWSVLVRVFRELFLTCPDAFVDPSTWSQKRALWQRLLFDTSFHTRSLAPLLDAVTNVGPLRPLMTESRLANGKAWGTASDASGSRGVPVSRLHALWHQVDSRNAVFTAPGQIPLTLRQLPASANGNDTPPDFRHDTPLAAWIAACGYAYAFSRLTPLTCLELNRPLEAMARASRPVPSAFQWLTQLKGIYECQCTTGADEGTVSPIGESLPFVQFVFLWLTRWVIKQPNATHAHCSLAGTNADSMDANDPTVSVWRIYTACLVLNVFKLVGLSPSKPKAHGLGSLAAHSDPLSLAHATAPASVALTPRLLPAQENLVERYSTLDDLARAIRVQSETQPHTVAAIHRRQRLLQDALETCLTQMQASSLESVLAYLVTELTKANLFSYSHYVQKIIARGQLPPTTDHTPTNLVLTSPITPRAPRVGDSPNLRSPRTPTHATPMPHVGFLRHLGILSEGELQARQVVLYKSNHLKFDHPDPSLFQPLASPPPSLSPLRQELDEFRVLLYWQARIAARLPWLVAYDAQTRCDQPLSSALLFRLVANFRSRTATGSTVDKAQPSTWRPQALVPALVTSTVVDESIAVETDPWSGSRLAEQITPRTESVVQSWVPAQLDHTLPSEVAVDPLWNAIFGSTDLASKPLATTLTPYLASRLVHSWFLPMVRYFIVKETEIGVDNWRVITQPGSSLLNTRQLCTVFYILAQVELAVSSPKPPQRLASLSPLAAQELLTGWTDEVGSAAVKHRWEITRWLLDRTIDRRLTTVLINDLITWRFHYPALVTDLGSLWELLRGQLSQALATGVCHLGLVQYAVTFVSESGLTPAQIKAWLQEMRGQWKQWQQQLLLPRTKPTTASSALSMDELCKLLGRASGWTYVPLQATLGWAPPLPSKPSAYANAPASVSAELSGHQIIETVCQFYGQWQQGLPPNQHHPPVHFLRLVLERLSMAFGYWLNAVTGPEASQLSKESIGVRGRQLSAALADALVGTSALIHQEPLAFSSAIRLAPGYIGQSFSHSLRQAERQIIPYLSYVWQQHFAQLCSPSPGVTYHSAKATTEPYLAHTTMALWWTQLVCQHIVSIDAVIQDGIAPLMVVVTEEWLPQVEQSARVKDAATALLATLLELASALLGVDPVAQSAHDPQLLRATFHQLLTLTDAHGLQAARALQFLGTSPPGPELVAGLFTLIQACAGLQVKLLSLLQSGSVSMKACCLQVDAFVARVISTPWIRQLVAQGAHTIYQAYGQRWAMLQPMAVPDQLAQPAAMQTPTHGHSDLSSSAALPGATGALAMDWLGQLLFAARSYEQRRQFIESFSIQPQSTVESVLASIDHGVALSLTSPMPSLLFQAVGLDLLSRAESDMVAAASAASSFALLKARLHWLIDVHAMQVSGRLQPWYDQLAPVYRQCLALPTYQSIPGSLSLTTTSAGNGGENGADAPYSFADWLLRAMTYLLVTRHPTTTLDALSDMFTQLLPIFDASSLIGALNYQMAFLQPERGDTPVFSGQCLLNRFDRLPALTLPALDLCSISRTTTFPSSEHARSEPTAPLAFVQVADAFSLFMCHLLRALQAQVPGLCPQAVPANDKIDSKAGEGTNAGSTDMTEVAMQCHLNWLRALLEQLQWFLASAPVFSAMHTLALDYHAAKCQLSVSERPTPGGTASPGQATLSTGAVAFTLDHVYISLWLRIRAVGPLLPLLIKHAAKAQFIAWVMTLIQLLNSVLGPLEPECVPLGFDSQRPLVPTASLFDVTLDLVSVCLDEQPNELRTALMTELRTLSATWRLHPSSASRLKRILPFEILNVYTVDWKPNPNVPLNPWRWLDVSQPIAPPNAANGNGNSGTGAYLPGPGTPGPHARTDDGPDAPRPYAYINCTSLSLTYFNAKRYRTDEKNTFAQYFHHHNLTMACQYGLESVASVGTTALPTPRLAPSGLPGPNHFKDSLRGRADTPGFSSPAKHGLESDTNPPTTGTSATTQEEGEIMAKRVRT
ncbi:hypothetical protein H4R34_001519 [Dimargaris verticillata]|uniref:Mediator of RNA polymerase II transcription subunit 12 n=1 Tax=Dimargaris verticillata TaxID=2761393 RepID=A0A9W8B607_9FUNG|nr:hypothetical protein H4R34_001519 [Dimargaris verticillata]